MTGIPKSLSYFERTRLVEVAAQAASKTRLSVGSDQHSPICIYEVCRALGVSVRFNDIDMEGMYQKGAKPQIHLSAKRPLARRVFNCAHELGHHVFGHGSSIDVLKDRSALNSWENPQELLADSFAAHILLPTIGLRGAFNRRNVELEEATPIQMYAVANDFGVGYRTLITHLATGLRMLSNGRAKELKRRSPKGIRAELIGALDCRPLVLAGPNRNNSRIDVEIGTYILLPRGTIVETAKVSPLRAVKNGSLFLATEQGVSKVASKHWNAEIRISRPEFVGLAHFRHLEDAA